MKLKSFGCSFVYGSDLSDCPHGVVDDNPAPSQQTWPALLATHHGLDYQCLARPSASNLQILETLLTHVDKDSDCIYVVNWTWIERFGYTSEHCQTGIHPWNPMGWASILPSHTDATAKFYYKNLHSQFRDKFESLICIKTALDALSHKNINFVMTYTDDLIFQNRWHTSPATIYLQKNVRPRLLDFEGRGFLDWVKYRRFKISATWHPLEEAHQVAAEMMSPVIESILHKA